MYEQVSYSLLNDILDDLKPQILKCDLRHCYTRLGPSSTPSTPCSTTYMGSGTVKVKQGGGEFPRPRLPFAP